MKLIWVSRNTEKVEDHGVTSDEVEAGFDAPDWTEGPSEMPLRTMGEGTAPGGRLLRMVFAETEDGIFPTTAYPVRPRQRRTP